MQGAFFATPIMYAFSLVTSQSVPAGKILISSPIAQLMQDMRYILITPVTDTTTDVFGSAMARIVPFGFVAIVTLIAVWYFRRRSRYFAEEV